MMKYLQEYYLAKRLEKPFGKINNGDLNAVKHDTRTLLLDFGDFIQKLLIANVCSLPVFLLIK